MQPILETIAWSKSGLPFFFTLGLTIAMVFGLALFVSNTTQMNKPTHHTQIKLYVLPRPGQERTYTLANVTPEEHHHIGLALQAAKLEAEVLASRDDATLIRILDLVKQTHTKHGIEVGEGDIDLDEFRAEYQAKIPVLERMIQTWEGMGNVCATALEGISPDELEALRYALLTSHKEATIYLGMPAHEIRQRIVRGMAVVEDWELEVFAGYEAYFDDLVGFFGRRKDLIEGVLEGLEWEVVGAKRLITHIVESNPLLTKRFQSTGKLQSQSPLS